jgi:hypothetical protein
LSKFDALAGTSKDIYLRQGDSPLLEALVLELDGSDDKTQRKESSTMRNHNSDKLSKNIQQLIRKDRSCL